MNSNTRTASVTPQDVELALCERYRVLKPQSAGLDAVSYVALDTLNGDAVSLRRFKPTRFASAEADFTSRLKLADLLTHASCLTLRHTSLQNDGPFFVVDYCSGQTLPAWLQAEESLQPGKLLWVARGIAGAIAAAHRLSIFHGGLHAGAVHVEDGRAVIDFTRIDAGQYKDPLQIESASESGDVRCLAQLLHELLGSEEVVSWLRSQSPRHAVALLQLLRTTPTASDAATPLATEFEELLASFTESQVIPPGTGSPTLPGSPGFDEDDTTAETPVAPVVTPLPDGSATGFDEEGATAETPVSQIVPVDFDEDAATAERQGPALLQPLGLEDQNTAIRQLNALDPAGEYEKPVGPGDILGRYRLTATLGQGGMGTVYKAEDVGTGETVAVKLLNNAMSLKPNALRRFQKEARLLAAVNNPYVTNLIEVNEVDGRNYLVLEFVDGSDLKKLLAYEEILDEQRALNIAADVARALVDAHQQGIVHRDIKPDNILLARQSDGEEPQVKLSDFGIARHIDQSESLAVTQAGSVIGTPLYMAPEQCKAQGEICPQSDIYALGVTLFQMLTGRPPFTADDSMKLAAMHCFEAPPVVSQVNPHVSDAASNIVARALAKRPEDRFTDAAHLLTTLEKLLRGDTSPAEQHPQLPDHDASRLFERTYEWQLDSSPEELWPLVSDTNRVNRAMGLPAVEYSTRPTENPDGTKASLRYGEIKLAGIKIRWQENPFEWIEGRRMGVLREFEGGPFKWFMNVVELQPGAAGGTLLKHTIRIAPQNVLGRVLANIEGGGKARRALDKVYRRIDQTLNNGQQAEAYADPFETPAALTKARQKRLELRTAKVSSRGVRLELANKLAEFIEKASSHEVMKIRPIALATRLKESQDVVTDACLVAASEGLLSLEWDILCPVCRVASSSCDSLKELTSHAHCEACNLDFESDAGNAIEMVFRVPSDLRDINTATYCAGGPFHLPHVVAQIRLQPGEVFPLELSLPCGEYLLRGPGLPKAVPVHVQASAAPSRCELKLEPALDPRFSPVLRAGGQMLTLTNAFDYLQVVRIENTIPRQDVITAAAASALPRFRELFPGQVLDSGRLMSVGQITLLVTGVENADDLYNELGDADAYGRIRQHLTVLDGEVRRGRGAVVKTQGEGLMAAFEDAADAVSAALRMRTAIADNPETAGLRLNIAIHRGPSLIASVNDRLDYFGATARTAVALVSQAGGGIAITEQAYGDPVVAGILQDPHIESSVREIDLPCGPGCLVQTIEPQRETS